jgi:hypothetical protein
MRTPSYGGSGARVGRLRGRRAAAEVVGGAPRPDLVDRSGPAFAGSWWGELPVVGVSGWVLGSAGDPHAALVHGVMMPAAQENHVVEVGSAVSFPLVDVVGLAS